MQILPHTYFLCIISFFQQNCLIVIEMDLLSTHNIGFGWGMKTSFEYSYYSVFMIKVTLIHIFLYAISFYMCFGSLKESSYWDGSFEYPQHVVIDKKIFWLCIFIQGSVLIQALKMNFSHYLKFLETLTHTCIKLGITLFQLSLESCFLHVVCMLVWGKNTSSSASKIGEY